ncbi:DUF1345 domain-containing protein [Amnibacterium sp.]|uniref:DUF1345 domain-containing protein n=1 Tax=Amnibacterium sp. TaxID=1872496 RepID=UPI002634E283|nr:DUF1345 domain-containing protein [Amnibacterium sp.]MCU1472930.1 hypothetical protein [Amnibacterium sp.]
MTGNTYDRHRFNAGLRLVVMAVVGIVAGVGVGLTGRWMVAPDVGWAAAAGTFLLVVGVTVGRIPPDETAAHATREDGSRTASHVLLTVALVASLGAVGLLLLAAGDTSGAARIGTIALALGTVALSWLLTHTLFALRYAALYYEERGGIDFNQRQSPTYGDFLYLAFTVGMAFQVSDTAIRSRRMRGVVLRHALLSYVTGAVVLATTINLVSGLIQ